MHPVFNFNQCGHITHHVSVYYVGSHQTIGYSSSNPVTPGTMAEKARRPKNDQNLPSHCSLVYPAVENGATRVWDDRRSVEFVSTRGSQRAGYLSLIHT